MKPKILILLVAGLAAPAVHANTLIWSDNFNVGTAPSLDAAPLTGRLSGTLAPTVRPPALSTAFTPKANF
jgi:hypothetical protein